MTNQAAYILRENTGTSGLVESARAAVLVLADHDIPHLIVGGLAVQEYGYPRVTIDVDIVVPDVLEAVEWLMAIVTGPFFRVPQFQDRVEDRRNGVLIRPAAGEGFLNAAASPFPQPSKVAEQFQIVSLEELLSLKLDSWNNSPNKRLKDKSDVVELILRRQLSARPSHQSRRPCALYGNMGRAFGGEIICRLTIFDLRFASRK